MLWVGGSITAHSIDYIGYHGHAEWMIFILESTGLEGFFYWLLETFFYATIGIIIGLAACPLGYKLSH